MIHLLHNKMYNTEIYFLDIHQAGYQQTDHNLVSSLSGSHQQSVMVAHVAGLMSVARFFVECPVVSSLVAKLKL